MTNVEYRRDGKIAGRVIGIVRTIDLNIDAVHLDGTIERQSYPSEEFEVLEVGTFSSGIRYYVTNSVFEIHADGFVAPQVIVDPLVKEYVPIGG